jgi:hypothetical protein
MLEAKILAAAAAMLLVGGLTACGSHSSSSATGKAHFCRTFDTLTSRATPRQAADRLRDVGTPGDMGSSARHGLEVLVDHLRELPDQTKPAEITTMVRDLHAQDGEDVRAFIAYYAQQCQDFPTDAPS